MHLGDGCQLICAAVQNPLLEKAPQGRGIINRRAVYANCGGVARAFGTLGGKGGKGESGGGRRGRRGERGGGKG